MQLPQHWPPYTVAAVRTVAPARDIAAIFHDATSGPTTASHHIMRRVLDFAGKDTFAIPADALAAVQVFADGNPMASVTLTFTAMRDDTGSTVFYGARYNDANNAVVRQVHTGAHIRRMQFSNLFVSGSDQVPVDGYESQTNPLLDDYCSGQTSLHTVSSARSRVTNAPEEFANPDPEMVDFIDWRADQWTLQHSPGDDFAVDLLDESRPWIAGCATIHSQDID